MPTKKCHNCGDYTDSKTTPRGREYCKKCNTLRKDADPKPEGERI